MRLISFFFWKCSKFNLDSKNEIKMRQKIYCFSYNCIWIGIREVSLLLRACLYLAVNVLKNSYVLFRSSRLEVFLEIRQNSQESTCARVSFLILKKRLWHRRFPPNFAKFLRTPFVTERFWGTAWLFSKKWMQSL